MFSTSENNNNNTFSYMGSTVPHQFTSLGGSESSAVMGSYNTTEINWEQYGRGGFTRESTNTVQDIASDETVLPAITKFTSALVDGVLNVNSLAKMVIDLRNFNENYCLKAFETFISNYGQAVNKYKMPGSSDSMSLEIVTMSNYIMAQLNLARTVVDTPCGKGVDSDTVSMHNGDTVDMDIEMALVESTPQNTPKETKTATDISSVLVQEEPITQTQTPENPPVPPQNETPPVPHSQNEMNPQQPDININTVSVPPLCDMGSQFTSQEVLCFADTQRICVLHIDSKCPDFQMKEICFIDWFPDRRQSPSVVLKSWLRHVFQKICTPAANIMNYSGKQNEKRGNKSIKCLPPEVYGALLETSLTLFGFGHPEIKENWDDDRLRHSIFYQQLSPIPEQRPLILKKLKEKRKIWKTKVFYIALSAISSEFRNTPCMVSSDGKLTRMRKNNKTRMQFHDYGQEEKPRT